MTPATHVHICSFSDPRKYQVRIDRKTFRFDWSDRFGPIVLNRDGSDSQAKMPYEFLEVVSLWYQQGKRLTEDGFCIWTPKPVAITKHLGGRHHRLIGEEIQGDRS